ncbi:MAG: adenylosuccinate lyase, partial [Actinomycetota bacterium]|nr:adenylosuccinate lyase [Actinomycetota bacterium]
DVVAWKQREAETHHDVAAFVDVLAGSVDSGGEWVHYGLTSSDVLDTALGVILAEASDLLLARVATLFETVRARAVENAATVMVGRTHGIWAEPTSFGLKLATWAFELARDHQRLLRARQAVAVGKISGAVGNYAHTPPAIEETVCRRLGIGIEPASSQVTHRDRHAEFLSTLALIGSSLERFATEIRHLQRSEVGEVGESFGAAQKGSSAMPHKRNPIAAENITGLSRLLRAYAGAGLEDVALWHERDISHSSVERVALPDACLLADFALERMNRLVVGLVVDIERMAANLDATRGLVYSQTVLLALVKQGMTRDEAYRIVQRNAMVAWEGGGTFHDLLAADLDVTLDKDALSACFDPERSLANTAVVFDRLAAVEVGSIPT